MKMVNFLKIHIKAISIIICIILIIFLIGIMIYFRIGSIDAWIGFFGAILGGGLTLLGVKLTLDKQDNDKNEQMQILSKPIFSVNPFMGYSEDAYFRVSCTLNDELESGYYAFSFYIRIQNLSRCGYTNFSLKAIYINGGYQNRLFTNYPIFNTLDCIYVNVEVRFKNSDREIYELRFEFLFTDEIYQKCSYTLNVLIPIEINNRELKIIPIGSMYKSYSEIIKHTF